MHNFTKEYVREKFLLLDGFEEIENRYIGYYKQLLIDYPVKSMQQSPKEIEIIGREKNNIFSAINIIEKKKIFKQDLIDTFDSFLEFRALYSERIYLLNKAIDIYEKSGDAIEGKVATYWNNLGEAWYSKGQYDKAIEYFEQSLKIVKKAGLHHRVKAVEGNLKSISKDKDG